MFTVESHLNLKLTNCTKKLLPRNLFLSTVAARKNGKQQSVPRGDW